MIELTGDARFDHNCLLRFERICFGGRYELRDLRHLQFSSLDDACNSLDYLADNADNWQIYPVQGELTKKIVKKYHAQRAPGCCGQNDVVVSIGGETFIVGFNDGH